MIGCKIFEMEECKQLLDKSLDYVPKSNCASGNASQGWPPPAFQFCEQEVGFEPPPDNFVLSVLA